VHGGAARLHKVRERQRLVVSRQTGAAVYATEVLPDADWDQRVRELKDSVPPPAGGAEARFLTVACNGCGRAAALDFDHPQLPGGWVSREAGEFCPACSRI
jgi:hypothetical protein